MNEIIVNQSKTANLVGCSRNNINKMWQKEKDHPGSYSFFTDEGKINIADYEFIESYGDHIEEWIESQKKPPVKKNIKEKKTVVKKVKVVTEKKEPLPEVTPEKKKTKKQLEQEISAEEINQNNESDKSDPEMVDLAKRSRKAKYVKTINDAKKSQIDLDKSRSILVETETLGDTCIGYLSALNLNIMEMPKSFVDEFEAAIKSKRTRSDKIDIILKPICAAIAETIESLSKELDKERHRSYRAENKIKKSEKI